MLSYQHAYHAGNMADCHKHDAMAMILTHMTRGPAPLHYIETHAGRGLYDLRAKETLKTGEAAQGWGRIAVHKKFHDKISAPYMRAVRSVNEGGGMMPFYPGSPRIAATLTRAQDKITLFELHPAEHMALKSVFKTDGRVKIHKRDGLAGVLGIARARTPNAGRGVVLIDPSYEVKSEYESMPGFLDALLRAWPDVCVILWAPLLPAARHKPMLAQIIKNHPKSVISECRWAEPGAVRGMYGSLLVGMNWPRGFIANDFSFITES